jgi:hypothetical protein
MKENNQEIRILCCEFGNMEIVKKSSNKMIAYVTNPKKRPLNISNNDVSSLSKNNLKKVAHELKKSTCPLKARLQFYNDIEKLAELENTTLVTRNGVHALRIQLSSENYDANGSYAKNVTSFIDLKNGNHNDVTILCWPFTDNVC